MKQIAPAKYFLIKHLKENIKEGFEYACTSAVLFSSVRREDISWKPSPSYDGRILFKEDLLNLSNALENYFDQENGRISKDEVQINKAKHRIMDEIAPSCDAIPILNERIKESEFLFKRMTEDQVGVLDLLEFQKEAVIEGMAGPGKTVIALERQNVSLKIVKYWSCALIE